MSDYQLRNPHSVLAVLETRPNEVVELVIPQISPSDIWKRVEQMARRHGIFGIPVSKNPDSTKSKFPKNRITDTAGRGSTPYAIVRGKTPITTEALFEKALAGSDRHGLWIALDSLQDPQNVGAIFRSAAFFGVQGILMTQERSAPLTATVYDVASGGVEYVPFSMVSNLQQAFEKAKKAGLWVLGTSEHVQDDYRSVQKDRPWLLVLGNEEHGMRRLTEELCDVLCRIPPQGEVSSLNVSVAAGVMMSHFTAH